MNCLKLDCSYLLRGGCRITHSYKIREKAANMNFRSTGAGCLHETRGFPSHPRGWFGFTVESDCFDNSSAPSPKRRGRGGMDNASKLTYARPFFRLMKNIPEKPLPRSQKAAGIGTGAAAVVLME
jgi:hypothetical protein